MPERPVTSHPDTPTTAALMDVATGIRLGIEGHSVRSGTERCQVSMW
jgi:hypothetical protein